MKTNPNPLLKKPLVTSRLANTHKVKISTLKTTIVWENPEAQIPKQKLQ